MSTSNNRVNAIMDMMKKLKPENPQYLDEMTMWENELRNARRDIEKDLRAARSAMAQSYEMDYKKAVVEMSDARNRYNGDKEYVGVVKRALTYYIENNMEVSDVIKNSPVVAASNLKMSSAMLQKKEHNVIMAGLEKENYAAYCNFIEMAFIARVSEDGIQARLDKAPKASDSESEIEFKDSITAYWINETKVLRTCYLALKDTY